MGVAGSAWGTTLSRLLQTALLLVYVLRQEPRLVPRLADWLAAFKRREVVRFTLIALPLLLHDGLWAFGMLLYGFLYAHLGTDSLAIMTTLGTLESILISLFFGLAVACSTLLGHRLGAEEYDEAWQHSQLFLLLAPVGALLVIEGKLTPGMMIACSILMGKSLQPVELAIGTWKQLLSARTSYTRLDELLKEAPPRGVGMPLPAPAGNMTVEGVIAVPPGGQHAVVRGLSMAMNAGDVVGVIGPSASGKSTLARLLVGVWPAH